jgi:hypothetical protein
MTTSRRSQAAPREHKVESQTKRDSVLKALRNSRGCDAAGIFLSTESRMKTGSAETLTKLAHGWMCR